MAIFELLRGQPLLFIGLCAVLGLVVGSFLNVLIYRLPVMMERDWKAQCRELLELPDEPVTKRFDLVSPGSRCPHCGTPIKPWQNIPVLSFLWLQGRCAACGQSISLRYPLVEILTGLLSAIVAWRFGVDWATGGALLLSWGLIGLALIDFDTTYLPDSLTLPLLWMGLAINIPGTFAPLEEAVLGAIAGYGLLWGVYHLFRLLTGKQGMGYGDFKLLAMLGAWCGITMLPAIILLSSLAGAVIGVGLILLRGHDRNIPIPFGPYLAIAGWLALTWGESLNQAYLSWIAA